MKKSFHLATLILVIVSCQNISSRNLTIPDSLLVNINIDSGLVSLGGERQYVETLSKSNKNPVLLFIHGGPGQPETPLLRYFNSELTTAFTLVIWEQRGAGKSFQNNPNPENVTLEQLISDAHELTLLIKKKYNKNKIFIAGFSWGSVIGMNLAIMYPEDYIAYIGISQVINMKKGMEISQKWIETKAKLNNDTSTLNVLRRLHLNDPTLCNGDFDCFGKQVELITKYDGFTYNKKTDKEIEKAKTAYKDYRNYNWNKAMRFSFKHLEKDLFSTDFTEISQINIPIYFIQGRYDWNVPSVLIETFFKNISAPNKQIIWFEYSGHNPLDEEAKKFNDIMIKTIAKT
ncbi:MAG TPA: alpha/beta hydrolase [Bacteroidales bacterium]|nr:alpha/beta hydrolase [Bacteroidales bacterium]